MVIRKKKETTISTVTILTASLEEESGRQVVRMTGRLDTGHPLGLISMSVSDQVRYQELETEIKEEFAAFQKEVAKMTTKVCQDMPRYAEIGL